MSRARLGMVILVLAQVIAGARVGSAAPPLAGKPVDYEAAFAASFPERAGVHLVADWALYAALVAGDVVAYAARVDPAQAEARDLRRGKVYQTQLWKEGLRGDSRLGAAFADQRRRLRSMVLSAEGDSAEGGCPRLVYRPDGFRLIVGQGAVGQNRLSHATILPTCADNGTGFQITAARSPRFDCWAQAGETACGWRLSDMPKSLKRTIEDDFHRSIKLRWRWRGLSGVVQVPLLDENGNRSAQHGEAAIPTDLALEFVGEAGQVLWTAKGAIAPNHD